MEACIAVNLYYKNRDQSLYLIITGNMDDLPFPIVFSYSNGAISIGSVVVPVETKQPNFFLNLNHRIRITCGAIEPHDWHKWYCRTACFGCGTKGIKFLQISNFSKLVLYNLPSSFTVLIFFGIISELSACFDSASLANFLSIEFENQCCHVIFAAHP